jgi:hypothetical protein
MEDWQHQVVEEKAQLDRRLQQMVTFENSEEFKRLPDKTKELLWRQAIVMSEYSALLDLRIREFAS